MAIKGSAQTTLIDVTDAYSVMLTSEAYTFQGNSEGAPAGSTCSTDIVAYCGDIPCKISVSSKDIVCPTGISASVANNNSLSPTITFKTTAVIKAACEATVPISVDGLIINKKFSFAIAKTGEKGDTGKDGKQLFAKCLTASDIATKTATITPSTSFSLYVGATVSVTFNESNTATSPTLNVNSTGAKPIYAFGAALSRVYYWVAKSTVQFVYNGSAWVMTADSAMSLAAQWACENDTAYIEGSKIYAGSIGTIQLAANSITAEKIDVDDLFAQKITATHLTIEGDSVFKGTIDGADGVFAGSMQAKKVYLGSTDLTHVSNGDLGLTSTTFTLDGENAIIQQYYDAEDGGAGGSYYDKAYIATIGGSLEGGPAHAQCELRSESYRRSEASGELRLGTSFIHVDPDLVKIYSDTNIDMSAETIVLNGTNWDTFKSQHGYDWSTFGTANTTDTWVPVMNGSKVNHRVLPTDVAATIDGGCFQKRNKIVTVNGWGVGASSIIFNLPSTWRPVKGNGVFSGFCYNISNHAFYPVTGNFDTNGVPSVYAISTWNSAYNNYAIYNSSTDRRSNFQLYVTGSWLAN